MAGRTEGSLGRVGVVDCVMLYCTDGPAVKYEDACDLREVGTRTARVA